MYQWLFKKNGFQVSSEAYLLYFNGKKNEQFFNNQLKFDVNLISLNLKQLIYYVPMFFQNLH